MPMRPSPWPLWIAHRGAGKLAPENTLAAFRLGAQHGYTAFECDVKLSADGVPFLLHDATLDRTTNAQGPANALTWSELSRLDAGGWHSGHHAGEPIASFAAIATFCLANDHALDIEIKPSPGCERQTGEVVALEAARRWAGRDVPPLLSSFDPEALEGARAAAPQLPRALLIDGLVDGWFERALQLGAMAVVANYRLYDAAMVRRLHDAGLWAMAYTVNDEAAARALLAIGLDGLCTDAVDRFLPSRGRQV
ncbi:MAG: glycerophosphodiester phosphodiesterase [Aquincola sp.]|nr:glycerophosphodiester phosphodiesterase [Aquincola sp.]